VASPFLNLFSSGRIWLSRILSIALFLLLVFSESAHGQKLTGDVFFVIGLLLVGMAVIGRLWCSLFISGHKNTDLVTEGPYSITRNPLYFFSFIGFIGIAFTTERITFVLIATLVFALVYSVVIPGEEKFLQDKFGSVFSEYRENTPRFFPRFNKFHESELYTVNTKLFWKSMWDAIWFIWLVAVIQFIEALQEKNFITPVWRLP
jgi:protein-S-isoprenylcysteine O-methyltransferase Ste14